jgi:hypothetical protein
MAALDGGGDNLIRSEDALVSSVVVAAVAVTVLGALWSTSPVSLGSTPLKFPSLKLLLVLVLWRFFCSREGECERPTVGAPVGEEVEAEEEAEADAVAFTALLGGAPCMYNPA